MSYQMRKSLSAPGMYSLIRQQSQKIPDTRNLGPGTIPLSNAFMSAVAMFSLKEPSMLQFYKRVRSPSRVGNLQRLFQIGHIPGDTAMRETLDPIATSEIQKIFKSLFTVAQRGKVLEDYSCLDGNYFLSIDGTGCFSSSTIHCDNCCEKHHRDGRTT